jgi:hypothetical protein
MSDAFVEVQEEIRQERLMRLWQRYGNLLISFVVGVVLITAGLSGYRYWDQQQRLAQTNQLYALMNDKSFPDNLSDLKLEMRPSMQALLYLEAAHKAFDRGRASQAASFYEQASALDGGQEALRVYKGLSVLMVARLQPDQTVSLLEPLAQDSSSVWQAHALLDLAAYEGSVNADYDKALSYLNWIGSLANAPDSVARKAEALIHVYSQKKAL